MANRHHHKKLRAEVLARMKATGESYQRALSAVTVSAVTVPAVTVSAVTVGAMTARPRRATAIVDLVHFTRFGRPMTLATFAGDAIDTFALFGAAPRSAAPSSPLSLPAMRFLRPRGLN
jgi:hypothetical protein